MVTTAQNRFYNFKQTFKDTRRRYHPRVENKGGTFKNTFLVLESKKQQYNICPRTYCKDNISGEH